MNIKPTVLVILPSQNDLKVLDYMDNACFIFADLNIPQTLSKAYIEEYVDYCCTIIESEKVDGILCCNDRASILTGYLCDRFSLPGPTLESMFLCLNKYYFRERDRSGIWYAGIDVDANLEDIKDSLQFPFFLKPCNLYNSLYQNRIYNYGQLVEAVDEFKNQKVSQKNSVFGDLFSKNLDVDRYPYAIRNLLVAEELIQDARQFTIEGWSDSAGNPHIWAIADNVYDKTGITLDHYFVPAQINAEVRDKICNDVLEIIVDYGITSSFWDVELWIHNDKIVVTEINGRLAPTFEELYLKVYEQSLYKAAISLCVGDEDYLQPLSPLYELNQKMTAGHFYITAYGEGKVNDLIDFDKLAFLKSLNPEFYCQKNDYIKQNSTAGTRLARITVSDSTSEGTVRKANSIRNSITKKPASFPAYI